MLMYNKSLFPRLSKGSTTVPMKFLGIIGGQDPSDSKSGFVLVIWSVLFYRLF